MRRVTFLPEPDFCFALSVNHLLWDLNDVTLVYGDGYCDAVKTTKIVSSLDFYNSKQRERFTRNGIKLSQLIGREMRCAEISLQKQLNVVVTEGLYWWLLLVFGSGGVREGQNMAQNWPRLYLYMQNFWLQSPWKARQGPWDPGIYFIYIMCSKYKNRIKKKILLGATRAWSSICVKPNFPIIILILNGFHKSRYQWEKKTQLIHI